MAGMRVEMSSDEAKLFKGLQRIISQNNKVEQSFKKIGDAGRRAGDVSAKGGKSAADGFAQFATKIGSVALGFASVNTAMNTTLDIMRKVHEEQQKAAQFTRNQQSSRASLTSVAKNAADLEQMERQVNEAAIKNAISPDMARKLRFDARSGSFDEHFETAAKASQIYNPGAVGNVANKLPSIFSGLNATQAINATDYAAAESNALFEEFAKVAPTAASGSKFIGGKPAETLAALGVMASAFNSPDEAATSIGSFGKSMSIKGFSGGLLNTIDQLQAMSPEERKGILGESQELHTAYRMMTENEALIREREKGVAEAIRMSETPNSSIDSAIARHMQIPKNRAAFEANRAQIEEEIAREERYSVGELNREAAISRARTQSIQSGEQGFSREIRTRFAEGISFGTSALGMEGSSAMAAQYGFEEGPAEFAAYGDAASGNFAALGKRIGIWLGKEVSRKATGPKILAQPDVDK